MVLTDRYVYASYTRDIVRGCDPWWVREVYDFVVKRDIAFYFGVPIEVASERILAGRPKLKYYEAGMDLNLSNDPCESYRISQSRTIEHYKSMAEAERVITIDGTSGFEEQQYLVRKKVMELIPESRSPRILARKHVLINE